MDVQLVQRFELKVGEQTLVVPDKLLTTKGARTYFKLAPYHQGIIKLLTGKDELPKNASISGSAGILAVQHARHLASGNGVASHAHHKLMIGAVVGSDDMPKRDMRKRKRNVATPDEDDTVSFEVPRAEQCGLITVKRTNRTNSCLNIPFDETSIARMIHVIAHLGISICESTRPYKKTGKYKTRGADDNSEPTRDDAEPADDDAHPEGDHASDSDDDANEDVP